MEEKLTHWKKTIDPDYIGTYVLPEGNPINVHLIEVKQVKTKVRGISGVYTLAYFDKNPYFDKPMILSAKANLHRLENLFGSPYIERWKDKDVTLIQEMDQVYGAKKGVLDWALRISPVAPVVKTADDYPAEVNALQDCETMEELQQVFMSFTKDVKMALNILKNEMKTTINNKQNDNK